MPAKRKSLKAESLKNWVALGKRLFMAANLEK